MLKYFGESLKYSILAKLKYRDLKLESFDQIVKKIINAMAKAALWFPSNTRKIDQHCPRNSWPANSIIIKSWDSIIKNPRVEEHKIWGSESLSSPQRSNKFSKKAWKVKKKRRQKG